MHDSQLTAVGEAIEPASPRSPRDTRRGSGSLGPKGARTRAGLLDATDRLLRSISAVSLTVAAVCRSAGTSTATFYVYFDDIPDIVHALALAATHDIEPVMAVLARWRTSPSPAAAATEFVETFQDHWQSHRTILNIRNLEADRGDARFLQMRADVGRRVINALAVLIQTEPGGQALTPRDAIARATVVYAAIERLAAAEALYPHTPESPSSQELNAALVAVLIGLMAPARSPTR